MITPVARFAVRHAVPVLVGWAIVVAAFGLIGRGVEDKVQPSLLFIPGTESSEWRDVREGSFNEGLILLLAGPAREIDRQGPAAGGRAPAPRRDPRDIPWSPRAEQVEALRPSPTQAAISIDLRGPARGQHQHRHRAARGVRRRPRATRRSDAHLAGIPSLGSEVNESSIEALHKGELIAAPILILVLLLVFRSPVAAAVPLLIAVGTVVTGFGIISVILEFTDVDAVALSAASMIGLALGVDYSLLIVTRFRSSLAEGNAPRQAASIAANTAGRTANFAGVVLLAIIVVAFFLSPGTVLLSMALGMAVVTVLSMVGAILVAPAAASLLGHRINMWQLGKTPEDGGAISRIVGRVTRRATLAAGLLAALLLLMAAPVLGIETTPADPRMLPEDSEGLAAFHALRRAHFGPEIDVALSAPRGTLLDPGRLAAIDRLERQIEELPLIRAVTGPGLIADATAEVRDAPKTIGKSRRDLASAERELTSRSTQLATRAARGAGPGGRGRSRPRRGGTAARLGPGPAGRRDRPHR